MTYLEKNAAFNNMTMISIWRNDKSFSVATCDEPHTGFRAQNFRLQGEAIAFAEKHYPSFPIWKELPDGSYILIQEGAAQ